RRGLAAVMSRLVLLALGAPLNWSFAASAEHQAAPLTAVAAVETRRLMVDPTSASPRNPMGAVSISPDGQRFVVRVVQGDVRGKRVWMEMYAGKTASLDEASDLRLVARLPSSGL